MPIPLALLLDILFGDPPNRLHPTAWMGSLIAALMPLRPHQKPALELLFGASLVLGGGTLVAGVGFLLVRLIQLLPTPLEWLATAVILKTTFSLRGLDRAALEVQAALETGDLPEARRLLSWHLVSRDTRPLTASQVAAATIESVAENTSDSFVAPLFFFTLGGLPLALAYRFANTADAMLGYRDAEREWLGKVPARLDDLLNFIPARMTGLFITLAAFLSGKNGRQAWRILRRDAHLTSSPNAGIPMSAMAGALGVALEKTGHYCLGAELRPPGTTDLHQARHILVWCGVLAAIVFTTWSLYVGM